MKSRYTCLFLTIGGILLVSACGSPSQQEEIPAELTPVDEADRSRYNINEDTEAVISPDSIQTDTPHLHHDH